MPSVFRTIDSLLPDMSWQATEEPPAKRRRFFSDPDEEISSSVASSSLAPATAPVPAPAVAPAVRSPLQPVNDISNRVSSANVPDAVPKPTGLDKETFENFIGDKVNPEVLAVIGQKCGDNLEAAVNMYFDGTWKKLLNPSTPRTPTQMTLDRLKPGRSAGGPVKPQAPEARSLHSMPESRYIGAFGVEGWATRSGTNLLKYGDVVKIERQKTQRFATGKQLVDVIVRFTDHKGSEIGRLAKEAANWVSSLIDQNVCRFEGTCVYSPERLRTNDTVFLQLRCYIRSSVFEKSSRPTDNRTTGVFEVQETTEERDLRLRQVSLVRLFKEINLEPTRAAVKHNRQGLLAAAESDENKANQQPKRPANTGSSSPSSGAEDEGDELEQGQLDALYKKAQSFDFNTPEAEPADTFAMNLRPYQKQSLHWMLSKEKDVRNEARESSMHPLWEEYTWPTKDVDDKELPQVMDHPTFYVNPYSGEMSLDFPVQEQHCLGGILADEMGLGKTIQMLSLVHSHKYDSAKLAAATGADDHRLVYRTSPSGRRLPTAKATLVIAPMSLLAQWHGEVENASKEGTTKSMVYYGNEKNVNLQALCFGPNAPDVIITSYGIVLSEYNQMLSVAGHDDMYHDGIFSLNFFRVILDEGHSIKNRQAKTSKACYELSAEHRWVLTGTPIVNRLEDLFSLVRFLRVEPWSNFSFWRTFITVPFESKEFMRALDVVQTVLEPLVMRRTKDMKTPDGQPLVPLPPKTMEIIDIELSKPERDVYDHIFTRAKKTFSANVERGTVMKAYTTIFAQILRLRQSCCHPILVRNQDIVAEEEMAGAEADAVAGLADDMDLGSLIEQFKASIGDEKNANAFGAHVLEQIRDEAANECPVCSEEPMIEQTVTGCWHSACKKCLLDYMKHSTDRQELPRCFNCREPINPRDLFQVIRHDDDPETRSGTPKVSLQRFGVNESSTKVMILMKYLRELRKDNPCIKSVVFSQVSSWPDAPRYGCR